MNLLQTLVEIVGADGVLTGEDVRSRFVSWVDQSPCQALAIVRPASTEQVSKVLAACHAAAIRSLRLRPRSSPKSSGRWPASSSLAIASRISAGSRPSARILCSL